jgi:hypothetical protein
VDAMTIDASERDDVTRELGRLAVHRAAPDELAIFDDLAVEYFADPQAALRPPNRDETLGFGLDLTLLTPSNAGPLPSPSYRWTGSRGR